MKKSFSIYDILNTIKDRPGMYIEGVTVNNILVYLQGYQIAIRDYEIEDVSNPGFRKFHDIVKTKYGRRKATPPHL